MGKSIRIIRKSEIIEVDSLIGGAKEHDIEPYRIERIEDEQEIVWYGTTTNWRKVKGRSTGWEFLKEGEFRPCEIPEFEKSYKKLISSKS